MLHPLTHQASLILSDGSVFPGMCFGAEQSVAGEVVFNTGMVGYVETLTDPSYRGQILCSTYPLVGNYGVPPGTPDFLGLPDGYESDRIHVAGFLIADYSHNESHWKSTKSLSTWLKENKIPGLYGIDTRALTQKLRNNGSMSGKIVIDEDIPFEDPNLRNLVAEVSCRTPRTYGNGDVKILAIDCGMKYNIIRSLVKRGATVRVVPYDYDFSNEEYDGLFISNGPGDPSTCKTTIENIARAINEDKPIFGICLGNQLLGLAAGGSTYKLKYGNRGHNQPVKDMLTGKVSITPQNHGFAIATSNLGHEWKPYFVNINDSTNEGIIHTTKPIFSVQFHPEACGGPEETAYLFDKFLDRIREYKRHGKALSIFVSDKYYRNKKVLLLGSGGLQIGQAGEFDYSGSQAIKALKEEGCETVLVNSNIATVQTALGLADKIYFLPVTTDFVEQIIAKERPDGILLGFGGQTALNVGIELWDKGILKKYGVRVLGTTVDTIKAAEDRDIFRAKLNEIGEKQAPSIAVDTVDGAISAAKEIGYPVIIRAAFALGGLGSGFADNDTELRELTTQALAVAPQVLVEKSIKGWKELEYEVIRDVYDNCIIVCNMENFDPMGIHTGDSMVVAPSQTLTNDEYHMLRTVAMRVVRHLGIVGECNIQFALDPESQDYVIIEVNPRLSRSSALASKATGYPLAFVAAKLALGIELDKIPNAITRVTSAAFEPALDYIVAKIPRWDLSKFDRVSREIGSQMRSVGEVMSIGREFNETFQKALRMLHNANNGFEPKKAYTDAERDKLLRVPTDERIWAIADAFYNAGYSVDKVNQITKIDKWFLHKLKFVADLGNELKTLSLNQISKGMMQIAKCAGFSDKQIGRFVKASESEVRKYRKEMKIMPYVKQIDTVAAEFPAQTNYLYVTYHGAAHDVNFDENGILVLGSGTYRIGSSVEFDFGSVMCVRNLREMGYKTSMLNCNPETVSTDYDESDRLYFEEMSLERVLDIYEVEKSSGVVVSFGGQIPQNLAIPLHHNGVNVLGTSPLEIDRAEDRFKHSQLLDELGIGQPAWRELKSFSDIHTFCKEVGFPVLVRPSYVLSGAAMNVVRNAQELDGYLKEATDVSPEHPVVVSKFISGATEIDVDAVAANGKIVCFAISEHVEKGGVHSGDATLILPAKDLSKATKNGIKDIIAKVAKALKISGPFNMQVLEKDGKLMVIETNLRASRSQPFVAKVLNVDFPRLATLSILGKDVAYEASCDNADQLPYIAVKAPQFSWKRLPGADPVLGVEMASTGEVACFHKDKYGAYLRAIQATRDVLPKAGSTIIYNVDASADGFADAVKAAKTFVATGYHLQANAASAALLKQNGVAVDSADVMATIRAKKATLIVELSQKHDDNTYFLRRSAVDFGLPLVTNIEQAVLYSESLQKYLKDGHVVSGAPWTTPGVEAYDEIIAASN